MENNIQQLIKQLRCKDNRSACGALKKLQELSRASDSAYCGMDEYADMMNDTNSYVRNRGLILFAENSRWDTDYKTDEYIDRYLEHITDAKPITARQCIQMLAVIAHNKPELREDIKKRLKSADISFYNDSMQPLVYRDIRMTLESIDGEQ
ncbi:MAG: SufBD protein [Oscillospiraceae bacterium]|nr:SufBD protein [Oscillospiraceae bacterium]